MQMSSITMAVAILTLVILAAVPVTVFGDLAPAGFWGTHPERNQFIIVIILWAIIVTALVVSVKCGAPQSDATSPSQFNSEARRIMAQGLPRNPPTAP